MEQIILTIFKGKRFQVDGIKNNYNKFPKTNIGKKMFQFGIKKDLCHKVLAGNQYAE